MAAGEQDLLFLLLLALVWEFVANMSIAVAHQLANMRLGNGGFMDLKPNLAVSHTPVLTKRSSRDKTKKQARAA